MHFINFILAMTWSEHSNEHLGLMANEYLSPTFLMYSEIN